MLVLVLEEGEEGEDVLCMQRVCHQLHMKDKILDESFP